MSKCNSCWYSTPVITHQYAKPTRACVYILKTGHRRPCKPGEACTVYVSRGGVVPMKKIT